MNIKWNNETLFSKGIIVEKIPVITRAKKRFERYDVPGRNGALIVDKGTYDTFICSLSCHFNVEYDINEIKSFLNGFGKLSLDGTTEYEAMVNNQLDFADIDRSGFKKFTIQFLCNPIKHDINPTEVNILSSTTTLTIDGTANTYPVLEIVGNDDVSITFNGKTFNLYDLVGSKIYTLDCESKEIYDNNNNNVSNQMQFDFPYLIPGENVISYSGTITSFKIIYKKAFI